MLLVTASVLALAGCGQQIAEKAVESAVNNATNGQTNLDLSGGNMNIKDSKTGTSYQAGGNVSWPANFPADVYKVEGNVLSAVANAKDNSYWVMVETPKSVEDVSAAYQAELPKNGWTMTTTANFGGTGTMGAEKGDRTLGILIAPASEEGGKTTLTLSESKKQE